MFSVCPRLSGGGGEGGLPQIGPGEGGWVPHRGVPPTHPLLDLAGGVPLLGEYPNQGYPTLGPPIGPGWGRGTPAGRGTPPWVPPPTPPHRTWPGGVPPQVTDGVLDAPRSVCLLRSRRRTFLLKGVLLEFHFHLIEMYPSNYDLFITYRPEPKCR